MNEKPRGNNPEALEVGDVVLDLAQGRPMQIVGRYDGDVQEWSAENDYDLTENYGNSRFDTEESEAVFDCVYVGSIQSEPSKTYAFPASRLARVEVERAESYLLRVADEIRQSFLIDLLTEMEATGNPNTAEHIAEVVESEEMLPAEAVDAAVEMADTLAKAREGGEQSTLGEASGSDNDPGEFDPEEAE